MVRNNDTARATTEAGPLRALWAEVLLAALRDAEKGRDAGWIGSQDFRIVCTFAGLDPDAVADRLKPTPAPSAGKAA